MTGNFRPPRTWGIGCTFCRAFPRYAAHDGLPITLFDLMIWIAIRKACRLTPSDVTGNLAFLDGGGFVRRLPFPGFSFLGPPKCTFQFRNAAMLPFQ